MSTHINIITAVDVVAALSERTLYENIYLMDNSPFHSKGQGTASLATSCQPGQVIQWIVYALDLQTPVVIKKIVFLGASSDAENGAQSASECMGSDLDVWNGVVPVNMIPGALRHYRMELQMGVGQNSAMSVATPSLKRV